MFFINKNYTVIFFTSTFHFLLLQRIQSFHQSLERAFRPFDGGGVGEANPFVAERREKRTRDNGDAVIFGKISSKRFGIIPAFGLEIFSHVDEGIISLANDVLEFISQK